MLNCGSSKALKRLNILIVRFRDWEIWILSLVFLHVSSVCQGEILLPSLETLTNCAWKMCGFIDDRQCTQCLTLALGIGVLWGLVLSPYRKTVVFEYSQLPVLSENIKTFFRYPGVFLFMIVFFYSLIKAEF